MITICFAAVEIRKSLSRETTNWKIRAGNFRMVDIEINAWSTLFLNLETNLILYLYPEMCIKLNQSESCIWSREIWNFARHLRLICRNGRDFLIFKKMVLDFCLLHPKKFGLSKKLKVSTLDIRIKHGRD